MLLRNRKVPSKRGRSLGTPRSCLSKQAASAWSLVQVRQACHWTRCAWICNMHQHRAPWRCWQFQRLQRPADAAKRIRISSVRISLSRLRPLAFVQRAVLFGNRPLLVERERGVFRKLHFVARLRYCYSLPGSDLLRSIYCVRCDIIELHDAPLQLCIPIKETASRFFRRDAASRGGMGCTKQRFLLEYFAAHAPVVA